MQTIFEINSSSKTPASEVMRTKRSKDMGIVDKFNKQREDLAADSKLQHSVNPTATTDGDLTHSKDDEEDELKVINADASTRLHPVSSEAELLLVQKLM